MNVLSLSYGKDSLACLGACELLGIKIDKIVHAEVWATDDIPADLPPMVEFKKKADDIIKARWGLEVDHICATVSPGRKYGSFLMGGGGISSHTSGCSIQDGNTESLREQLPDGQCSADHGANTSSIKKTYVDVFYRRIQKEDSVRRGEIVGWPMLLHPWCNSELKMAAIKKAKSRQMIIQ